MGIVEGVSRLCLYGTTQLPGNKANFHIARDSQEG